MMKQVRAAAVQMVSNNNDFNGNRLRAEKAIAEAVRQGAELILLPEFSLAGYLYTDDFWAMAEPLRGRTFQWQKSLSETHGVYIGNCILENEGTDFYDTFILTGPGKNQFWTHRKIQAPGHESFLFRGAGINSNVFPTPIGRIGVVICFDSAKTHAVSGLVAGRAQIVLIAYSYPNLPEYFSEADRRNFKAAYLNVPRIYTRYLQAPVVVANKTGRFSSPLRFGLDDFDATFTGGSSITDREGNTLRCLDEDRDGVLVSQVVLGQQPGAASGTTPPPGGWLLPFSARNRLAIETVRAFGTIRYRFSKKRERAAMGCAV